ncbi:magnesium or manganese-dependent protein phosphatase [Streptomyces albus]|uniref:protein-serine/threonine phosphatase n=1 Tax=Streptomyces albus (strain ATCC 21838 / DSM 41398 / FERM P-419 / JCM 4703 / NBRC 107858) TaxID=1081613 RepID=A0A0B5EZJ2_STRA4|nr:magnesium or manganese-dependent protein phosphatase [Streptomyces albus]AOU81548.1 magnesium or manganese-dependent protein phosphatase [Streptomyces albus]AYN37241.1 hypothetical protein DUI70_6748 [Streptomyces albus]
MGTRADSFEDDESDKQLGAAVVRALLARKHAGLVITDTELRVRRSNVGRERFGGPGIPPGSHVHEFFDDDTAPEVERRLRHVVQTGELLLFKEFPSQHAGIEMPRMLALSAVRLEDAVGAPRGLVIDLVDITKRHYERQRLELQYRAADRIGNSLEVRQTTEELADLLVPDLGTVALVFLAEPVLVGEETPLLPGLGKNRLQCAAARADGPWPAHLIQPGARLPTLPDRPIVLSVMQLGQARLTDAAELHREFGAHTALATSLIPARADSAVTAPLYARGQTLGGVLVWRMEDERPFHEEDARLLFEIVTRAALGIDNARRFTKEHRAAVALQRNLLPVASTQAAAAETAGFYQPASSGTVIGGDWFDVIPLSSLRVALVVGDVVGHGLQAAATMGRLRAAIRTVATLDLPPDEVLLHLDDVVQQLIVESGEELQQGMSATCLYSIYDPVTCRCTMASAGHPPPALTNPEGLCEFVDLSPGPPLGIGSMPFEVTEVDLVPGSLLALYTDGLIEQNDGDIDIGMQRLGERLCTASRADSSLSETARLLVTQMAAEPYRDDVALLLARTRAVAPEAVAEWTYPAEPEVVAQARAAAMSQLAVWGLHDLAPSTELIVSELLTNAVRYAGGPVQLRLIRDTSLVCEVSDPSNTQPRLRRSSYTDEGGRGLFLVAQLASRWGSRYGRTGKTIWAEQQTTRNLP